MNVLLEIDDRKHVLLKQVLVLHLLRHFSEKTNLNTIDDDALKDGDIDVLVQMLKPSNLVLVLLDGLKISTMLNLSSLSCSSRAWSRCSSLGGTASSSSIT